MEAHATVGDDQALVHAQAAIVMESLGHLHTMVVDPRVDQLSGNTCTAFARAWGRDADPLAAGARPRQ